MAEENFVEEKLDGFLAKVAELRHGAEGRELNPSETVSRAAREIGLGSAVADLTCTGLRQAVDCEDRVLNDVRFWIAALVGLSFRAGGYEKGWLDTFNEQFFGKVKAIRDFPSPRELKLPRETAVRFRTMLQTAIGAAENKGKVGKVVVNKCFGFRSVKYWSESNGWDSGDGFTEADRAMLRKVLTGGGEFVSQPSSPDIPRANGLSEERKQVESLQRNLYEEQNKNSKLDTLLRTAKREVEQVKKELTEAKTQHECDQMARGELEKNLKGLQQEMERLREESRLAQGEWMRQLKDAQQRAANFENHAKATNDAIANVVSPIRRQIEDSRGKPMSVELGDVLLTHINRIIDALNENGVEI